MMDSKESTLTPSIVISPVDCLKDEDKNVFTSLSISISQTSSSYSSGHETYEYKKTEVRHYSTSSEPSLSPEKTVESLTSSPTETTLVAEDADLAESDAGTNCAPSSPTEEIAMSVSNVAPNSPEDSAVFSETSDGQLDSSADGASVRTVPFKIHRRTNQSVSSFAEKRRRQERDLDEIHASRRGPPSGFVSVNGVQWRAKQESSSPPKSESPSASSRSSAHVGLVNQAMTCYLNSLIQALFMTPEFRNALYKWKFTGSNEEEQHSIPYHLQKLFLNLQTSQRNAVETTKLTRSFGWDSSEAWHQHDIQELCRVMFEALERKFNNTEQADFIQRLYEGKMIDYVKCLECCTEKSRVDTFLDIPLPVKPFGNPVAYESIEEALDGFVQAETLDGNNQYFCEKCNKKCDAQKGLKFSHFPYILTLHLKRFDFDYNTMHRIKLNDKVSFPEVLNLNDYIGACEDNQKCSNTNTDCAMCDLNSTCSMNMDECTVNGSPKIPCNDTVCSCSDDEGIDEATKFSSHKCPAHNKKNNRGSPGPYIYELFSIMIHSGSASGGHYFAYIKDFDTNEWFCFNDDVVSPISHEEIVDNICSNNKNRYTVSYSSSTPYMLMYRQIDKEKNASCMKSDGFPDHIKALVEEVQKEDEEQQSRRIVRIRRTGDPRRDDFYDSEQTDHGQSQDDDKVICDIRYEPPDGKMVTRKLKCYSNSTLGDCIDTAARLFSITDIPLANLRLGLYNDGSDTSYPLEGDRKDPMSNLVPSDLDTGTLLLTVVEDAPESGTVVIKLVSFDAREVYVSPVEFEYSKGSTIRELKEKVAPHTGNAPLNRIFIMAIREVNRHVFSDDMLVQEAKRQSSKFYVAYSHSCDMETEVAQRCLHDILKIETAEVKCKFHGISRDLLTRFGTSAREISNSDWKNDNVLSNSQNGEQEDCVQKTTDDSSDASSNLDLKSMARSAVQDQCLENGASSLQNGDDSSYSPKLRQAKSSSVKHTFTVQHIDENSTELLLTVSYDMPVSEFTTYLAKYVGLPVDYLKLYKHQKDRNECHITKYPIGDLLQDTNGSVFMKILKPRPGTGSVYWKIHVLDKVHYIAPYHFDCALNKSLTVSEAKKIILDEMEERGFGSIPLERCRLRDVYGSRPRSVYIDDLTLREMVSTKNELVVEDREGPELVESLSDIIVLARNFDQRKEDFGKEFVLKSPASSSSDSLPNVLVEVFYEKLSEASGIPVDSLDVRIFALSIALYRTWRREDLLDKNSRQTRLIDNGHAFFYRDKRVQLNELDSRSWDEYMPVNEYLEEGDISEQETSTDCAQSDLNDKSVLKNVSGRVSLHKNKREFPQNREAGNQVNGGETPAMTNGQETTNNDESFAEPAKETPVKSYRSKERGLKIYVDPTPQRNTPEPTSQQQT